MTAPHPIELLTKAACRRLGLSRADVDRMFDASPLVTRRQVLSESRVRNVHNC